MEANKKRYDIKFREIPGWEDYLVSNYNGIILSRVTGKVLKTPQNNVKYRQVCLHRIDPSTGLKEQKVGSVAHFVCLAWCNDNGEYGAYDASTNQYRFEVGHRKENGRGSISHADDASNLYWCTRKENLNQPLYIERQRKAMTERWQDASFHESQRRKIREGLIRHYSNSEPLF